VRTVNQDSALCGATVFAVADGMGGHAGGEIASSTAVAVLEGALGSVGSPEGLVEAIRSANEAILSASLDDPSLAGMGTTLVAATLVGTADGDVLVIANVGDSRAYLFHDGRLRQVTDDHSLAAEMVRNGDISDVEAARHPQRHVITRALGIDGTVDVDLFELRLGSGDRILLCSDGLTNELSDEEITRVLSSEDDPVTAAEDLVRRANAHGGADNITVVVVDALVAESSGESTAAHRVVPTVATVAAIPSSRPVADRPVPREHARPIPEDESWLERRRRLGVRRALTFRVVLFVVLLLGVLAGAWYFLRWYAMSSYYVTSEGDSIVIYQGRPGGVFWFQPRLVTVSPTPLSQVLPIRRPALATDVVEPSLSAATRYVANLANEYQQSTANLPASPATTTTSTTFPGTPSGITSVTTTPAVTTTIPAG
jgi:protein phosphatase